MTPPAPCPLFHEPDCDTGWALVGPTTYNGKPLHRHLVPNCDMRAHQLDPVCWCGPEEDFESCHPPVYVHNSADGREHYETGDRRPN